jgi:hypothetical protein
MRKRIGILFLVAYIATIFAANWAISTFGLIQVWPGILAPAGCSTPGPSAAIRSTVAPG